ncbi:ATP-dependent DNA helicase [Roseateles sp. DAIF2]|uniref:ATP-dependent DNA helicase n=1 Tax=Roseateles sp. DAIF2 TaxID=2714952 RepID=UPI0018A27F10|nr:ATP-dependent DNA helicase [Roseateles sp. DAIF2]QPF72946.1 ATP-dependent DNA helicase [Roseateles sp. DAIF2]
MPAAYTVAVRELCEFTAKSGDLDLRFTPAPTAQEGVAGHAAVAQGRGAGYQTELSLAGEYQGRDCVLRVRGRADGYRPQQQRLEEIKTFKGRLESQPASHRALHWAQLKIYGWLLCQQESLDELELALVYYDIGKQRETVFTERLGAVQLQAFFEQHCHAFLAWAERQLAHRAARDAALSALSFPFGEFRAGQRALAEGVFKTARAGRCLLAQAPTGIGKTLGTLFPLLKAAPGGALDKLFFLAAKTSGRQLALDALARLPARPLRVLELVARDKACEHPDKACHGESCPLAAGFYDRLPAARAAACAQDLTLDQGRVREIAREHAVCPYYLSQELVRWADVVVGDYNYYFDVSALLHGMTQANGWQIGLLVDEAHNLVDRGRKMYTAELQGDSLEAARHGPSAQLHAPVKKALDKLRHAWSQLDKSAPPEAGPYRVFEAFPEALLQALQQCGSALTEHFTEHPAEPDPALQAFYFEAQHMVRMAELLDAHSIVDASRAEPPGRLMKKKAGLSTLTLRNLVPAPFLKPRLEAAHTSSLFSATLQPMDYYADLLGLPEDLLRLEVESPFEAAQLQVKIAGRISTRYPDRQASLAPIVALMAEQYAERPGNYLAFFSSYDYLQQAFELLQRTHPDLPCWAQSRRMGEAEQREFLARFSDADDSRGIGFAVLGGAFSEGIDLPGRRLIGAFVATLGLPQLNPVNEQIRARMQQLFGAGYDYTYLYPGLQKVVQAAGRVIRTTEDRGVVHLIDDRYARREVRALLPGWWGLG